MTPIVATLTGPVLEIAYEPASLTPPMASARERPS